MTSVERSTVVAPCSAACPGAKPEPVAVAVDHRVVKAGAPKPVEESGRIDRHHDDPQTCGVLRQRGQVVGGHEVGGLAGVQPVAPGDQRQRRLLTAMA